MSTSGASVTATNERVITLEEIGPDGRPQIRPAAQQTPAPPTSNSRKRRRNERKVQDGEVKQYFEDDNVDLKTLVAREKSRGMNWILFRQVSVSTIAYVEYALSVFFPYHRS